MSPFGAQTLPVMSVGTLSGWLPAGDNSEYSPRKSLLPMAALAHRFPKGPCNQLEVSVKKR